MATKKDKRAAALAKREAFMLREKRHGLEFQKQDRIRRSEEFEKLQETIKRINARHKAILDSTLNVGR